ncbi:hypothetical protein DH2020_034142 [Rehmannia glutinosa]|uniref:RING-type E3 ubiquitin transferase n=1 Tax=Rehmannia glutinosa TaxID=99300 RepID=A0ABR0VDJ1_REHGL
MDYTIEINSLKFIYAPVVYELLHDMLRAQTLSSKISECCPPFCSVYAVSKGKLSSMRPSDSETNTSFGDDSSETSSSTDNSSGLISSSQTDWTENESFSKFDSASLLEQRFQALSTINQTLLHKRMPSNGIVHPRSLSVDTSGSDLNYTTNGASRFKRSATHNHSWNQASTSRTSTENEANINFELEKLRTELRHIRGMYAMTQGETIDASRKLNELQKRRLEEQINLKQISFKEEEAKELARREKKRYEDTKKEAEFVKDCAEREVAERKEAEIRASRETKEKENLENALNGCLNQYRQFTWEEILEILSQIRHPHLLILLGACPDRSCLVYEFMENGSLEDRLIRKNNTTPLLWFDRFRIAWEVGSALVFLHNAKPKGIIHRDLKPANILLDRNYMSKIGDVGLSTMVNSDILSLSAAYNDTAPVGTLCYIDPEYQRTGVVSPKSDVYALGIIILQLLTGKPAIALAHKVENAIDNDRFTEMLDLEAGGWPIEETKNLALVALKCTEMRQRDRPDLEDEVLPVLEKLKDFAEKARDLALVSPPPPPKHFTCPILNEVMADPCVAADGYTYDRVAIEAWLNEKDTSPVTELPLPHKFLTPNYTLLSAIMEWKSGTQT